MSSLSRAGLVLVPVVSSWLVACAVGSEGAGPDVELGRDRAPIIAGQLDTVTPAAMTILLGSEAEVTGICTGLLFRVDPGNDRAYVLTAGHCAEPSDPPFAVAFGTDNDAPVLTLPVAAVRPHPDYDTDTLDDDYAVLTLRNLPANLPRPIPLAAASTALSVGTRVRSVGYGNITSYENENDDNTRRWTIERAISTLTSREIGYDQRSGGGICIGDSGGPVLLGHGLATRAVGVHSYVYSEDLEVDPCSGESGSGRVSRVLPFVQTVIAAQTPSPANACDACRAEAQGGVSCAALDAACTGDCLELARCIDAAWPSAEAESGCNTQFPDAVQAYREARQCACTACAAECTDSTTCAAATDAQDAGVPTDDDATAGNGADDETSTRRDVASSGGCSSTAPGQGSGIAMLLSLALVARRRTRLAWRA